MTKTGWFVAVIIIIVAAVALLWWNSASAPAVDLGASSSAPTDSTGSPPGNTMSAPSDMGATTTTLTPPPPTGAPTSATVAYDGSSFSPSSVTITKGDTVTFTASAGQVWVASGPHPAHTGYDATDRAAHCAPGYTGLKPFDQCASGSSYSFTFDKAGSFPYHNHLNATVHGTIVVQ